MSNNQLIMTMDKKLIYIAGALRGEIPEYIGNVSKMIKHAEKIRRLGFAVYIPCLDILQGVVMGDLSFKDYFDNSYEILKRCDAVSLVPGFEKSNGVKEEIEEADSRGIPVLETEADLLDYSLELSPPF